MILLLVELLYTIQVSLREHALTPEPFLLVGQISAICRVLIVTAEFGERREQPQDVFRRFIIELVVLTVVIVALTGSLLLRKKGAPVAAARVCGVDPARFFPDDQTDPFRATLL